MGSVRVDALALRLAAPATMREAGGLLRRQAETEFVPAVLAAMQRRLERTYGPRALVLIRRLSFRCALRPAGPDAGALAELLGEDLALQVERTAVLERGTGVLPQTSAAVQVYRDAAHREAAALIAAAERRVGPHGDKADFGRTWRALIRGRATVVGAVLARCLLARRLDVVLRRLSLAQLEPLARALGDAAPAPVMRAVSRALEAALEAEAPPPGARRARAAPATPRTVRPAGSAADAAAGADRPDLPSDAPPTTPSAAPIDRSDSAPPTSRRTSEPEAPPPETTTPAEPPPARAAALGQDGVEPPEAEETAGPSAASAAPQDAAPEDGEEAPAVVLYESKWCALLYLLNIALRLEAPERLWQVGVDEGAALAAVFARLAGADDDPASGVLSSRFPEPPAPPAALPAWARDELVGGTLAAAVKLTAPTASAEALQARLAAFGSWFARGSGGDVTDWMAACLLAVFEAMTGEVVAPGALAERFGIAGRIELSAEEVRVVMPLEAIDLAVRRAGLDADPGWLPWLKRRMVFVFEDDA